MVDQTKDYVLDLTKAMENDPAPVVQTMTEEEEQQNLIPAVKLVVEPIEGEAGINLAAKVNSDWMKWYLCCLLLVASAMVLTNHFIANGGDNPVAPDGKLIISALIKFIVFLCAACFMFCTMKQ